METQTLISILSLVLSLGLIKAVSSFSKRSKSKAPPGPYPWPIVGNILQIGDKPHKSLAKLAQTHGPLISLKLGQIKTVLISSSAVAKTLFQNHDLSVSSRIVAPKLNIHDHPNISMIFLPVGPAWRNLRKISNSYLFSASKLDDNQHIRTAKIQQLLSDVGNCARSGEAVAIDEAAFRTSLGILAGVLLSIDLRDSDSSVVIEFKEMINGIAEEAVKPEMSDVFPSLGGVFRQPVRDKLEVYIGRLLDLFDGIIDERLEARKEQSYVSSNDMLDSLLSLTEEKKEHIDRKAIKHLLMDLATAGTDTTSCTLEWAMAELLHNPETLRTARAEMEQTIKRDQNMVFESDVANLPYLRAIIKETLRLHPPAPLLVPRKSIEIIEIGGYTIPKDAQVMVNMWAIGRDPSLWENPDSFKPERFLESKIDARGQHFELIPFGAGRRICPGLPLAMRMLHSMLGSLILRFDWKLEDGVKPESLDMDDKLGSVAHKARPLRAIPIQLNY